MTALRAITGSISILAFLACSPTCYSQGVLTQIHNTGPRGNRINLVILAEGYTSAQSSQFLANAQNIMAQYFLTNYGSEYSGYFNVFALFVASVESGSDHPSQAIFRNTYFNSTYESFGIPHLLTIPDSPTGVGKVIALLAACSRI